MVVNSLQNFESLFLRHDNANSCDDVFSVIEPRTQLVIMSGKLSSLGGTVAGKVAKRFLKRLLQAKQGRN